MGFSFRNGTPSHDTFRYAFSVVDHGIFSACLRNIAKIIRDKVNDGNVSIDGKALRRATKRGGKIPFIVNAWVDADGIILGEVQVNEKSNEITAIPAILKMLDLQGCIVSIDAIYGEDYCRARTKHAAANRATLRRMALSLASRWAKNHKCGIKDSMIIASQSREARLEMLT